MRCSVGCERIIEGVYCHKPGSQVGQEAPRTGARTRSTGVVEAVLILHIHLLVLPVRFCSKTADGV